MSDQPQQKPAELPDYPQTADEKMIDPELFTAGYKAFNEKTGETIVIRYPTTRDKFMCTLSNGWTEFDVELSIERIKAWGKPVVEPTVPQQVSAEVEKTLEEHFGGGSIVNPGVKHEIDVAVFTFDEIKEGEASAYLSQMAANAWQVTYREFRNKVLVVMLERLVKAE